MANLTKNLPIRKSKTLPASIAEQDLIREMVEQPSSVARLKGLSDFFIKAGAGPRQMLEVVKGMLEATTPRYNHETKEIGPVPDWKVRERGVYWLYKVHMDFVNEKTEGALPPHFVAVFNDFREQMKSKNPKELDAKYGVVE